MRSVCVPPPRSVCVPTVSLEQVSRTTTCSILCKFCGSKNVVKNGMKNHVQYYLCRNCGRAFAGNDATPGMHYPPDRIAAALNMFYEGLSIDKIRRQLESLYGVYPSDSTVYEWIIRFTKAAVKESENVQVQVGHEWVADETMLKLDKGVDVWFWDIEDSKTRFLLASHMSLSRTTQDAQQLMERAYQVAGHAPKVIVTDKLAVYLDGIELVFGADTKHVQSQGFKVQPNTNLIERFHGTLKSRNKTLRSLHNMETARIILDGWLVNYNFFRPHEALADWTPGEAAKAAFKYKTWLDVVKGDSLRPYVCSST